MESVPPINRFLKWPLSYPYIKCLPFEGTPDRISGNQRVTSHPQAAGKKNFKNAWVIPHTPIFDHSCKLISWLLVFNDLRKQLAQIQWLMMVNDG